MAFSPGISPEPAAGRSPGWQDISRLGWALFIMALSVQAGGLLLLLLNRLFPALEAAPWYAPLSAILLPMAVGYPVFFLLVRCIPAPALVQRRRMSLKQFLLVLTVAFGLSYLANMLTLLFSNWFSRQTGFSPQNPLLGLDNSLPAPLLLVLTAAAAPVLEEWVFRSMVLSRLRQWGEEFGVVCSALLFALYHGNLSQFCYVFLIGLILGYVASRYGVRYSIAMHMCLNLPGTLILSFIDLEKLDQLASSPAALLSSPQEMMLLLIPSLLLSLFMFAMITGSVIILAMNRQNLRLAHGGDGIPERVKYRQFFCSTGMALFISMHILLIALSLFF